MAELKIPIVVKWEDIKSHLVLCKDCKYCVDEPWMGRSVYICNRTPWQRSEGERKAEDFCSRGERREEWADTLMPMR